MTMTLLQRAEQLWADLQEDKLGGYSGISRPFWIKIQFQILLAEHDEQIALLKEKIAGLEATMSVYPKTSEEADHDGRFEKIAPLVD